MKRERRSLNVTFGFQVRPAPSLAAIANLYRLADPEQRPAELNQGRKGLNFDEA
jgi:hypothetical protein